MTFMLNQKTVSFLSVACAMLLCIPIMGTAQSIRVDKPITESDLAKRFKAVMVF